MWKGREGEGLQGKGANRANRITRVRRRLLFTLKNSFPLLLLLMIAPDRKQRSDQTAESPMTRTLNTSSRIPSLYSHSPSLKDLRFRVLFASGRPKHPRPHYLKSPEALNPKTSKNHK